MISAQGVSTGGRIPGGYARPARRSVPLPVGRFRFLPGQDLHKLNFAALFDASLDPHPVFASNFVSLYLPARRAQAR